jgi:hypothetical protein
MVNIKAAIEMVMHFLVLAFMSAPLFNELIIVVHGRYFYHHLPTLVKHL